MTSRRTVATFGTSLSLILTCGSGITYADGNVILLTLDGVRHQEFFGSTPDPDLASSEMTMTPPLERFWRSLASDGVIYGAPGTPNVFTTSNPSQVSLPGYYSIFSGALHTCLSNDCGRITTETFPERVRKVLDLDRHAVASVSSWDRLAFAVESRAGSVFTNAGRAAFHDPAGNPPEVDKVNRAVREHGGPSATTRWDRYTWALAMHYLEAHRPRFLHIGLNDSDDLAHQGNYPGVIEALRRYDVWMLDLEGRLGRMGEYGKSTTLIVTTDHGRGRKKYWINHGHNPDAAIIWLYARGPYTPKQGKVKRITFYTHRRIRPTIELLLGVCPLSGLFGEHSPFPEVVSGGMRCES